MSCWHRDQPPPEPTTITAEQFAELAARPATVAVLPPTVDEQLVTAIRGLTIEVRDLRRAVERLANR